jgi:hypothetical protein
MPINGKVVAPSDEPFLQPKVQPGLDRPADRVVSLTADLVAELLKQARTGPVAEAPGKMQRAAAVAGIGQQMLVAISDRVPGRLKKRRMGSLYGEGGAMFLPEADGISEDDMLTSNSGPNLLTGQMAETFGSRLIEEGLSMIPRALAIWRMTESVQALAAAREAGMTDIAKLLEDGIRQGAGAGAITPRPPRPRTAPPKSGAYPESPSAADYITEEDAA